VKHLVLAELLHVERRRLTAYIDTHAGRPYNCLDTPGYQFGDPRRQPRAAWADEFMRRATSGDLGREIKSARYTKMLQEDRGGRCFWKGAGLASSPVYPGSLGIALASGPNVESWFCGECDPADQKQLRAALPPRSVFKSLLSGPGRARVEASLRRSAFILIDPFDLDDDEVDDARLAREFTAHAASRGAVVVAWYPLVTAKTPANVAKTWSLLASGLKLEVRWSRGNGLKGSGLVVANVGERAAQRVRALWQALAPLYETIEICERNAS
jgi:23S rRNA A2030 N6-methylase RlmJ